MTDTDSPNKPKSNRGALGFSKADTIQELLQGNRDWVAKIKAETPEFFSSLAEGQSPKFLWIGCSDSRVPASEITNQLPGSIFVHRNIANLVLDSDFNLLSVLHFSLYTLKIRDIVVVGHRRCGGITAALSHDDFGFIEGWIGSIRNLSRIHAAKLKALQSDEERVNLLCELNVKQQITNLENIHFVRDVVSQGEEIRLHGWVYDVSDGLIHQVIKRHIVD